jgi:hypothetical protein
LGLAEAELGGSSAHSATRARHFRDVSAIVSRRRFIETPFLRSETAHRPVPRLCGSRDCAPAPDARAVVTALVMRTARARLPNANRASFTYAHEIQELIRKVLANEPVPSLPS